MKIKFKITDQMIAIIFLSLIGFMIYSNSIHGEFVSDDYGAIVDKKNVLTNLNIKEMWKAYDTRIVSGFSFAINYSIHKKNVVGYHVLNIIIHIINSVLVYLFVLQILQSPKLKGAPITRNKNEIALLTSLLFIAHPIQTQAVSYIVQRSASLSTLFFLSSLISYGKGRLKTDGKFYFLSLIFIILAMLAKESACIWPIILIFYDSFFEDNKKPDFKKIFVFTTGIIVIFCLGIIAKNREEQKLFSYLFSNITPNKWQYFLTEINIFATYLRLLFFPFKQSHSYDYTIATSLFEPKTLTSIVLFMGMIYTAILLYKKNHKYLSFAIFYYIVGLSIYIAQDTIYGKYTPTLLYEHWLYLSMFGFSFFVVAAAHDVFGIKNTRIIISTVVIILCFLTFQRNKVWETEIGLWENVVKNNPKSIINQFALGCAYQKKGQYNTAYRIYESINEKYRNKRPEDLFITDRLYLSRAYNNLGIVSYLIGKDDESIESFKKALLFQPSNADAALNLRLTESNLNKKFQNNSRKP